MKNKAISYLNFILLVQFLGLTFFFLFRLILLFSQKFQLASFPADEHLITKAFLFGLRFDLVIACYIIFVPLLLLSVASLFNFKSRLPEYLVAFFLPILFILSFFICAANIPYFGEFNKHINGTIFTWLGNGSFVTGMILHEPRYYVYFFVFLILVFLYLYLYLKISRRFLLKKFHNTDKPRAYSRLVISIISIILIAFCILGGRGRISKKSPIRVGTAFFSNYFFPNQLGLNPVFVLLRSSMDLKKDKNRNVQLIPVTEALSLIRKELSGHDSANYNSPIGRYVKSNGFELRPNIILILMESMSAHYMQAFGGKEGLTPFLDSLYQVSLSFNNFYSDGIHTMNGLYATFCSFPTILAKHPLDQVEVPQYMGLPYTLKQKGFNTSLFITHDDQFDNTGGFFAMNGFDEIIAQKDYPSEKVLSTLGVPDDFMFEFSIPFLRKLSDAEKPFFVAYLTATNHGPITIPEYFKPTFTDEKEKAVQYSDWALSKFFHEAKKEAWFNNTIFVFLADHGNVVGPNIYDMSYTYNHIPLIIHSEKYITPSICQNLTGQIDVFPILMGLLNMSYFNNTFGVNTISEKRPFIFFSADDKIGCVSDSLFSIDRIGSNQSLYNYRLKSTEDLSEKDSMTAREMKNYSRARIQSAQYIISEKFTFEEFK